MEIDTETVKIFLEDSREGLADMARELVVLEENPDNRKVLDSIFRTLHSLKGNAALMEYRRLSALAHAGEGLLGRLRKGEIALAPNMISALLAAVDTVRDALIIIEQTKKEGEETFADLKAQLEALTAVALDGMPPGDGPKTVTLGLVPLAGGQAPAVPLVPELSGAAVPGPTTEQRPRVPPVPFRQQIEPLYALCRQEIVALHHDNTNVDLLDSAHRCLRRIGLLASDIGEEEESSLIAELCVALERLTDPLRKRRLEATPELIACLERGIDSLGSLVAGGCPPAGAEITEPAAMLAELEVAAVSVQREAGRNAPTKARPVPQATPVKARVLRVDVKKIDDLMNLVGEYVIGSSRLEQQIADLASSLARLQDLLELGRQQLSPVAGNDFAAWVVREIRDRSAELGIRDGGEAPLGAITAPQPRAAEARARMAEYGVRADLTAWQTMAELVSDHGRLLEEVVESREELDQVFSRLQEGLLRVRMMPVSTVFQKFPRVVRDLRHSLGKEIRLVITGDETEVDKSIVEVLSDPLLHIIRNAADHGIEPPEQRLAGGKPAAGTIHLSAAQEGNQIVVRITDDGRGLDAGALKKRAVELGLINAAQAGRMIDREAYALIFHAGFSTATVVTELSGRGVGMDVVKENLARIKGTIAIESKLGQGTKVSLWLPLTLAIVNALLVEVKGHAFAIPLSNVTETIMLNADAVRSAGQKEIFQLRGHMESLVRLEEFLQLPPWERVDGCTPRTRDKTRLERPVVLVESLEKRVGLLVDEVRARKEIVIKPLGGFTEAIPCLAGATILGDGRVVPILDIGQIVQEVVGGITTGELKTGLGTA